MRQPVFYKPSLKPHLLANGAPADIPLPSSEKTLKTFPKTSQGNPEHQRLIKQATV
jgi:hypothetical protein